MLGLSIPAYASITVSPTRLEIDANKVRNNYATTAIEVRGEANKDVRYRVYTGYFTINEKSEMEIKSSGNDVYDISKKVRYVPSEFTIPAGKTQKVRVNVAGLKNLPDGESRAVMFLEDVAAKEYNVPNESGIGAQLIIKTRVGVPVYVDKGKYTRIAEIENFEVKRDKTGLYTEMKVLSKGTSKIRYSGKIQIIKDKKLVHEYNLNPHVVGGNNYFVAKQPIEIKNIKGEGEYVLRLVFSYNDEKNNRKNIKKDAILKITGEI